MGDLLLEVLSHHGPVLKEDNVEMVLLPTKLGPTAILRNYAPFYTALKIGVLTYRIEGVEKKVALGTHGIAEVYMNHISVFCHTAENAENIDMDRARKSKEKAEAIIARGGERTEGGLKAELALKKALVRLAVGAEIAKQE